VQTTPLTKLSKLRENLSQKLGGPEPKTWRELHPILIPDLGDRSHYTESVISPGHCCL